MACSLVLAGAKTGAGTGDAGACGNGVVDTDETCDDGGQADGDGCSAFCRGEETALTLDAIFRVRRRGYDRLSYATALPGLPSELVGRTPVRLTLRSGDAVLANFEVPAKAWQRVEPRATVAVPGGQFASTRGRIGGIRLGYLRVWPMQDEPMYRLELEARVDLADHARDIGQLTSIVRVGEHVFIARDTMRRARKGSLVRNVRSVP